MRIIEIIKKDLRAIFKNDPAAKSLAEILLTYSGFHALLLYRFAHYLHTHYYKTAAKVVSAFARFLTGIEIHPAAQIGSGVFIDHGSGVVIGETAKIGNNVTIYQGVTLGGTGKDKGAKRHPTICDNVMISAGAKVLGPFTVGEGAKIGAGSIVLKEVPPNATVVGVPGRVVKLKGTRIEDLDQTLPDPVFDEIAKLNERIKKLEALLNEQNLNDKA